MISLDPTGSGDATIILVSEEALMPIPPSLRLMAKRSNDRLAILRADLREIHSRVVDLHGPTAEAAARLVELRLQLEETWGLWIDTEKALQALSPPKEAPEQ